MIVTLAWKEVREHQAIWLTMVIMTVVLGLGLAKITAPDDPGLAVAIAALTILGMAAAYGVVCGSMMFAGEHEGGTLTFLDIFLGRRGLLWLGKFAVGILLVVTQAFAVALVMRFLQQDSPHWITAIVGNPRAQAVGGARLTAGFDVWFYVLPAVTLEAYAWGLLGSSLTQKVLAGATVAAICATPVWLIAIVAPPEFYLFFRIFVTLIVLAWSYGNFLGQSREMAYAPPLPEPEPVDQKERFLEIYREYEREEIVEVVPVDDAPTIAYDDIAKPPPVVTPIDDEPTWEPKPTEARSSGEVLWWLTFQQARPLPGIIIAACLVVGILMRANPQVLWPLATLVLGIVCGTMAFASEQRDLSYQFLAAQHLPVRLIWRFKLAFWGVLAILSAFVIVSVHYMSMLVSRGAIDGFTGTLPQLLGPTLFFSVWLVYGFCTGQIVVWYCAKTILALLVSGMVAAIGLGLWLPSILTGGMSGWQLWLTPLLMLAATGCLVRAWAGGRIKERQPVLALVGFGAAAVLWAGVYFAYRGWEIPRAAEPMDLNAFRDSLPIGRENAAANAIHQAIARFDDRDDRRWLEMLSEVPRLPAGVLERPRTDGHLPLLKHLVGCDRMTRELVRQARAKPTADALDDVVLMLALSRNLRNKASIESYLVGIRAEEAALQEVDRCLEGRPDRQQLQRIGDELNRHAKETPPPVDCVQAECFRSGGALMNPSIWSFNSVRGAENHVRERWLAGSILTSLEMPWETERNIRLWRLVWVGQFRAIETPHWQLPKSLEAIKGQKQATHKILQSWLPAESGRDAGITRGDVARWLDASWLADERLFFSVVPLRESATRARWRVDAARQAIALRLYDLDEGKLAPSLQALAPKYLPDGLPVDPYSGEAYRYRVEPNGATLWSTGPDRIDHGGHRQGTHLADEANEWTRGDFDLILTVRHLP